jgi:hypothetical protein
LQFENGILLIVRIVKVIELVKELLSKRLKKKGKEVELLKKWRGRKEILVK